MVSLKMLAGLIVLMGLVGASVADYVAVDFEDLSLPDSESYWSGNYPTDGIGGTGELTGFVSRGAYFNNFSDGDWGFWEGFAYSNMSDTTTAGYTNQYSAYTGSGFNSGDDIYAVGFVGYSIIPTVTFPRATSVIGGYFTNTTYAALSMLNGEGPAKRFGGPTGDDPDWFLLTITGRDGNGNITGSVDFYLGDYRFSDNNLDYIVDSWEFVDLTSLGLVKSIEFTLSSSDVGEWGMNTPAYFAMDNLIIPEPSTMFLMCLGALLLARGCRFCRRGGATISAGRGSAGRI